MVVDARRELEEKLVHMVSCQFPDCDYQMIANRVYVILNGYEVQERTTEIALRDSDNIEHYVKRFLVSKQIAGLSPNTLKHYGSTLKRFFEMVPVNPCLITADDIRLYLVNGEMAKKWSKTNCQNIYRVLSSFFVWMVKEDYIAKNPLLKVESIKKPKVKKEAFSDMDIEKIRNACKTRYEKMIVEVLLSTGCRVAEFVSIKVKDISQDGKLKVFGKGQKERYVYLNAKAQMAINLFMQERSDDNPYLNPKGVHIAEITKNGVSRRELCEWYKNPEYIGEGLRDKSSIGATLRKIGERAGVENCHPHRFRRTCATNALRRGMPIEYVSKMLGHESIETTQIYLDLKEDELEVNHKKFVI